MKNVFVSFQLGFGATLGVITAKFVTAVAATILKKKIERTESTEE